MTGPHPLPVSRSTTRPKAVQRLTATLLSLAVLSGCATPLGGPAYERPSVPTKTSYAAPAAVQPDAAAVIRPDWWNSFGDPYLDTLIRRAIASNNDLKILAARIELAQSGISRAEAGGKPSLGLDFGAQTTLTPQGSFRQFSSNATGLNWELDIWGKLQKSVTASEAGFKASEADWRAGYLLLASQVANAYFQIRLLDELGQRQQTALAKNRQILNILQNQVQAGITGTTRVLQQQAEIRGLEQQLLDFQRQRQVAENQLATLLGTPAGELAVPVAPLTETLNPVAVPVGLPSDLLARRPDLVAAEYRVLQAHELIGRAKLAKLPTIGLTGSGSLVSAALSGLLSGWSLGLAAAVSIPVFDRNLDLDIDDSQTQKTIAVETYRKTVITAFEEVENALTNLDSRRAQETVLEQRLRELQTVSAQIRVQVEAGLASQLDVFEAERSLLGTQQDLLLLRQALLADTVELYKALGGGWPVERVALAAN